MSSEPKLAKIFHRALTLLAAVSVVIIPAVSLLPSAENLLRPNNLRAYHRRLSVSVPTLPDVVENNLADLSHQSFNRTATTPLFFHVPKASGTTIKDLYSKCYHLVEANHIGGIFPHNHNDSLAVLEPWVGRKYVNVDMASPEDIARAKALGFADAHIADLVFTSSAFYPSFDLFSSNHKAAMFTVLRHPVERAISKFYYLQEASWERHYAPETKGWTIEQYVSSKHHDRDWMVRALVGKMSGEIDEHDLEVAKLFLKRKVLIGLTAKLEESVIRFDQYFGFDTTEETSQCQSELMAGGSNSHAHPKVAPGSSGWNAFAEFNKFDVQLYDYAVALFVEQSKLFADNSTEEKTFE